MSETVYCIDSDSIINLLKNSPRDIFKTLWVRLEDLMADDRLKVHVTVKSELTETENETSEARAWMTTVPANALVDLHDDEGAFINRITGDHAYLRNFWSLPENRKSADPWLIALGGARGFTVVSDEGKRPWKIPDICTKYGIRCVHRLDFIRAENWDF